MDPKVAFSANGTASFCQPMPWRYLEPLSNAFSNQPNQKKSQRRLEIYGTSHFDITIMIMICLSSQNPKLKFTTSIIWTFASSFSCPRSNFWWSRGQLQRWLYSAFCYKAWGFFRFKNHLHIHVRPCIAQRVRKSDGKKRKQTFFLPKDLTLPKANMVHLRMAPWNI